MNYRQLVLSINRKYDINIQIIFSYLIFKSDQDLKPLKLYFEEQMSSKDAEGTSKKISKMRRQEKMRRTACVQNGSTSHFDDIWFRLSHKKSYTYSKH